MRDPKGFSWEHFWGAVMVKLLINTFLILVFVMSFPFIAFSEEIYDYERMWPVLKQAWYFNYPYGIAIDRGGNVYVADTNNNCIQKFTSNGQFVTKWGSWGSGDGQFHWPSGITVDSRGYVYVTDTFNYCIQKFTSDGQFIAKWGSQGNGDGKFNQPHAVAVDISDYVYVADTENNRIQKFTSDGQFVTKWGSGGNGDGQFTEAFAIAVDNSGSVYVADLLNSRIQKFSSNGQFTAKWGSRGSGDGQFFLPYAVAADANGNVYVADSGNSRIQKFTSNGQFVSKWGSIGSENGQFYFPEGITLDSSDNVYVVDTYNHRIQKFMSDGQFVTKWGSFGSGDGQFSHPNGIVVDSGSYVYVVDTENCRIQKFTSKGEFVSKWGSYGAGNQQFYYPRGIALDSSNNVYVADTWNDRVQKFTSNGQFVTKWGSNGIGDGQFKYPEGIALDSNGNVYVTDTQNYRVQKFTSNGQFVTKWGSEGYEDGQFKYPKGITFDSSSNVYVTDIFNDRIQKFTSNGQFVTKWGSVGNNEGELSDPIDIAMSSNGSVYVAESGNNRIQVFKQASSAPVPVTKVAKAIVVAGSGPYQGNNLWDATEMNANFAYRTLTYQGYTNETIYYLSSDISLDLNGDGKPDVDADATNSDLQSAITQWAKDAESLVLYLTGHGGDGTFRMSETEILNAEHLASWLNELQETMQGLITVIYDACESGSFVSKLVPPSGKQRILITSTSPGEPAYFLIQGALSFSYTFWSQIFGGAKIYDAYVVGKDVIGVAVGTGKSQNPQIDDNGNGIGNEKTDGDVARNTKIGKGFIIAGDIPSISIISQDQVLNGQTSATITVEVVTTGRITKVWAIVHSPDFTNPTDNPITDLPTFDLTWSGQNQRYEGTYNGFAVMGTYTVTVYAMNEATIISLPKTTKVEQTLNTLYTLTIVKSGTGIGTVTSNPAGINCGDDCSETYSKLQKVKLTAKADATSTFIGWSGGGCSGTKTCTVTVDTSVAVTADFALKTPDISVDQASINFGEMKVKKKATKTLKITNNGTGDLVITLSGLERTDFSIQGSSIVTIKAKKSYTLKVLFTPKSSGPKAATLGITSNDPDTPAINISLSGTAQ
jgi:hypothetical protein